jgi:hypothetical protein
MSDDLAAHAATLRAFVDAGAAERAMLLLDREPDTTVLIDVPAGAAVTLTEGEDERTLDEAALPNAGATALPPLEPLPPPEVDTERAEVVAPMGAIAGVAAAVRELARRYPGRSVLTVQWPTSDPEAPLAIAARPGEPLVIALGQLQFPMPEGWPPAAPR